MCFASREEEVNVGKTFKVQDLEKNLNFVIIWDENKQDVTCLCRMFEYYGFLL